MDFVQRTHTLDANCEGQSDSQSNGHSVGLLNPKITSVYLICAKYTLFASCLIGDPEYSLFTKFYFVCQRFIYCHCCCLFMPRALYENVTLFFLV